MSKAVKTSLWLSCMKVARQQVQKEHPGLSQRRRKPLVQKRGAKLYLSIRDEVKI